MKKIAPFEDVSSYLSYPRAEELSDGELLIVYESVSQGHVKLTRSADAGMSWSRPISIFESYDSIKASVPEIIKLQDGTVLAAANYRPSQPYSSDRPFSIAIKRSLDGGHTWSSGMTVYEGGWEYGNGCWEPAFLELPNGEIQLFFADESPYIHSDEQNISMLKSHDGGVTWTVKPVVVSFRKGHRDGMPVPLFLEDQNRMLLAIEDSYVGSFKPTMLYEDFEENWRDIIGSKDNRRSFQPLMEPFSRDIYAGAPYLARLPGGEVLLSVQTNYWRGDDWTNSIQMVMVGNEKGAKFGNPSYPFSVAGNKKTMWNSLEVLSDGRILALTSTDGYSDDGSAEIWMILGDSVENDS